MADEKKSSPQRLAFTDTYDFTYPSRAMGRYPKGFVGPVKADIAEGALKSGKARLAKPGEKSEMEETLEGGLPAELAEPQALTPNLSTTSEKE